MDSLFGAEGSLIVRFVVAFVIVLALIGLTFWLIRRFGGARVGSGRAARPPAAPCGDRCGAGRRTPPPRADPARQCRASADARRPERFRGRAEHRARGAGESAARRSGAARTEGARPLADAARALDDEGGWTPPGAAACVRPSRGPSPARACRAPSRSRVRRCRRASRRALAEPAPRAHEPPRVPTNRPRRRSRPPPNRRAPPDAALANMAQRLEAALRRPGAPEPRSAPQPAAAAGGVHQRRAAADRAGRTRGAPGRIRGQIEIRARQPRRGNGEPARPSAREAREAIAPSRVRAYRPAQLSRAAAR